MSKWDAIVIGAGAGGGVAAYVLASAGKKVLLLERGKRLDFQGTGRDHLRNHRLSLYGHNTGPELEGHPRVFIDEHGQRHVVSPIENGYNENASCIGGGTFVYGGQAWRFHPLDFKMASTYGMPEGSSLADWPITYEDLEPYYELAEGTIGVAGDAHPMPPHRLTRKGSILREAASRLGWNTRTIPLAINSIERDGRPACAQCQHCVGFACPVDAKNGTHNTVVARAVAMGNCEVRTDAFVRQVTPNGVMLNTSFEEAETIVLAAGAIETARLLLNSGIGNDQVGRHLQGHYYAAAFGEYPEPIWDGIGPGATTATLEFSHGNDGIVGGGMLADDFVMLPIVFAKWWRPSSVPAWGQAHKDWMREGYRRSIVAMGPVQEIPSPDCRVEVDPDVRDVYGLPVAKLSGTTHPETVRATAFMQERAREWLGAAGAQNVESRQVTLRLSAGQHQAGTCRMGNDPETSVVNSNGRVWGHDNLFIADGSVHVTNGGLNPVLTIMATAWRTADLMLKRW